MSIFFRVLVRQTSLNDEPTVFLDTNELSPDGTVALSDTFFSEDGSLMGYSISESGSDWVKIRIRDTATGKDYPHELEKIKFAALAWTLDNKGFFYSVRIQQKKRIKMK